MCIEYYTIYRQLASIVNYNVVQLACELNTKNKVIVMKDKNNQILNKK